MRSKITIEVDFPNGNLPIIRVISRDSDDVRDRLIQSFLQSLQHTSRWCTIVYQGETTDAGKMWHISPIQIPYLEQEINLMKAVLSETAKDSNPQHL